MVEFFVREIPLPLSVEGCVTPNDDGTFSIYINSNLPDHRKRAALLQTACKHAVKGGERLSEAVLRDLVQQMIDQKVTPTCPHGRPLVVAISHRELDRKFKRIQE